MKRTVQAGLVGTLAFAFIACNKSADTAVEQVTIDTAITVGSTYQLNLSQYGKVANIVKQVTAFTTSEISQSRSALTYTFSGDGKTVATEQVQIAVAGDKTSRGSCVPGDSTVVTVNLSIK